MEKAFVLLTAMPPTTGHLQLIRFASKFANRAIVILCTQPHEPFPNERAAALRAVLAHPDFHNVELVHYTKSIEQDPNVKGFWPMWRRMMREFGMRPGDGIIASERYGKQLAEETNGVFIPYDIGRELNPVKATPVRTAPITHFTDILPEFRPYLRIRITIFGAESTGKTTLSKELAHDLNGQWLFEYARPYLEETVNEITVRTMTDIWKGQKAIQLNADALAQDRALIVQDTDLFSTVGYWQFPHWQPLIGTCPQELIDDALALRSDLYIITRSTIPFEKDPLRYGGDKREGSDEYWINVCEQYHLPYVVLTETSREGRRMEATKIITKLMNKKARAMRYDRKGL